ncbi:MAG: hypothetical protein PHE32_04050 [Candidatus Shapirobacteria bacterium]|nr:hypothetical protein [Candidatus Shapirobacteria bacterium]
MTNKPLKIVSEKLKNGQTKYCLRCGAKRGENPNGYNHFGKFYGRHLFNKPKKEKQFNSVEQLGNFFKKYGYIVTISREDDKKINQKNLNKICGFLIVPMFMFLTGLLVSPKEKK